MNENRRFNLDKIVNRVVENSDYALEKLAKGEESKRESENSASDDSDNDNDK